MTDHQPAPIALFAYRRPEHLARTLKALQRNPEAIRSELFVFCDAARDASADEGVDAVQRVLRSDLGFAATHIIVRETNFGLARNITTGVSSVLTDHDRVIVMEDDLVVSPYFLRFMNEALVCYRDQPTVGSISGYCYPLSTPVPETYFIKGADCWGWATWRDRWSDYNSDGPALLEQLAARNLDHEFDFDGTAGFVNMLRDQIAGKNDSWAVRWHASCHLLDRLILYPSRALAHNIGNDGSGTHSSILDDTLDVDLSATPVSVGGIAIAENQQAREAICQFFRLRSGSTEAAAEAGVTPEIATLSRQPGMLLSIRHALKTILPARMIATLRRVLPRS